MPHSIESEARRLGAQFLRLGVDFDYERERSDWHWSSQSDTRVDALPPPALFGDTQYDNASAVLQALQCLRAHLPVTRDAIANGLRTVRLAGRFQVFPGPVEWILDVAHNPAAAATLAAQLRLETASRRTFAVCGILGDKDVEGIAAALRDRFDGWVVAGLSGPRALDPEVLAERLRKQDAKIVAVGGSVAEACDLARQVAKPGDRVVVFGSFLAVGPALEWLQGQQRAAD
jgi:dihydrofolate synthase/folylpolyglutamate synthase